MQKLVRLVFAVFGLAACAGARAAPYLQIPGVYIDSEGTAIAIPSVVRREVAQYKKLAELIPTNAPSAYLDSASGAISTLTSRPVGTNAQLSRVKFVRAVADAGSASGRRLYVTNLVDVRGSLANCSGNAPELADYSAKDERAIFVVMYKCRGDGPSTKVGVLTLVGGAPTIFTLNESGPVVISFDLGPAG